MRRDEAARQVGSTGSRFRSLIGRDLAFQASYSLALDEAGAEPMTPELQEIETKERMLLARNTFDEYVARAMDPETAQSATSNRLLHNLAMLLNTTFKPLLESRTQRHVHEGSVGVFALPKLDTDKWTIAQHEEFVMLEARRAELIEIARPDDPMAARPAIEMLSQNGDTVDGEHELVGDTL